MSRALEHEIIRKIGNFRSIMQIHSMDFHIWKACHMNIQSGVLYIFKSEYPDKSISMQHVIIQHTNMGSLHFFSKVKELLPSFIKNWIKFDFHSWYMVEVDASHIISLFDFRKNNNFNTSPKVTKKYYYNYNHQSIFWFAKNKPRNSCTHVQYVLPQLNAPYITNTHTNYYICIYTQQYQLGGYLPISVIIYKPCSLCRILYCHNDRVKWYFLEHILCEFFNQIISY